MIKDKTSLTGFNQVKIPKLKGHVKITLHNCRTGKNEVVEGENIITNAVRDIYATNYLGAIDYSKTMPLWSKWYGGILCYEHAFTIPAGETDPDPDDYFIQGNGVNECVAHAGGNVIPGDHDDDLLRGSPTSSSRTFTENSVKNVWEWLPSHGNSGKLISALSLTHADTGDAGTGANTYAFQNFSPFAAIQSAALTALPIATKSKNNVFGQYDDNHFFFFHQGENEDFSIGNIQFSSTKLTVHIRRLPFFKAGLFETFTPSDTERMFTVTLPFTIYCTPAYYFDYANKQLWVFSNLTGVRAHSNTTVNYAVIDCEAESVLTSGTIVSDTSELAPVCYSNNNATSRQGCMFDFTQIIKDGNYVYLPTGSVDWGDTAGWDACYATINGYKKINISNQSEQSKITYNASQTTFRPIMKAGGLLVSSGRVINNGVGYSCADQFPNPGLTGVSYMGYAFAEQESISSYVSAKGAGFNSSSPARYIVANKMVNTSKFNLPSPVQKTSNQSMAIEYTLTEVSE